jgi:L-ascorbate metabolism protein UlaG (beta-lactamase superfamily)
MMIRSVNEREDLGGMAKTAKLLTLAALGAAVGAVAWAAKGIPEQMGAATPPELLSRSPRFKDGKFQNEVSTATVPEGLRRTFVALLFGKQKRKPTRPVPLVKAPLIESAPGGLSIIWYGHSSALVEIEGKRVLFDPVWSDRCSPSEVVGPKRLHPTPIAVEELPTLDAIAISHDHYDHLDMATIKALTRLQSAPFLVPLGVAAHLDRWGVPSERIIELDWEDTADVAGLRFVSTAARHFSGRGLSRDGTLWTSWVIAGETRKVFYTGDSGYWDGYARIGAEHGPFDATLIQIGAYGEGWPDIHMTPEDGARAHVDVRGDLLIPLHWCTFNLAIHDWSEPADRLWAEAKARDIKLAVPRPGERVDVDEPPAVDGWWQAVA